MTTWGQLKTKLRNILFAAGEEENLVAPHDQSFLTAIVDLQTWVPCLQQDNTSIIPHCATFFHCGMTVFPAPHGNIFAVSVVDKINLTTGLEDPAAEIQWCSEVPYASVAFCHVRDYINRSNAHRCCLPYALFFGLPAFDCVKGVYPLPTGEGLPDGLPILPLGYVHAQTSTDASKRALKGTWAMERGKIYLGPWIQSTESVVVKWDGIKREWNDIDPIEVDPLLEEALMAWVDCEHRRRWEKDKSVAETPDLDAAYQSARQRLIHQCREETRLRDCSEVSHARSSPGSIVSLFFNDEQRYTAECAGGTTGVDVTQIIMAGTIGSSISKEDANAKAIQEARTQAEARLVCTTNPVLYWNEAQSYTAECTTDETHPPVEGSPVSVTIPANAYSSPVSQAAANALGLAAAVAQSQSQLTCTWWNSEQTFTAECTAPATGTPVTKTVAAHTHSSTVSQEDADALALNDATNQANEELICDAQPSIFFNTQQVVNINKFCLACPGNIIAVQCTVTANAFTSSHSQNEANSRAIIFGIQRADAYAVQKCLAHQCGAFTITAP